MKTALKIVVIGFVMNLFLFAQIQAQTFKINPRGTITACKGDSVQIEAVSGFAAYGWNTGSTNRVIKVGASGTYICGALDIKGNVYADSVKVYFVSGKAPTISMLPKNGEICKGDSLVIEVNKAFTKYKWNGTTGTHRFVLKPTASGYVTIETIDSNGCYNKSYAQYSVKTCTGNNCSDLIVTYPDKILCGSKDSVKVEVKSGFTSYAWADGSSSRLRVIKSAGWYVVTATDASGNKCTDSIQIKTGHTALKVYTIPANETICPGDSAKAYINEGAYDSIVWSNNKQYRNIRYAYFKPTKTTSYAVYAYDKYGCKSVGEFKITVKDTCNNSCGKLISSAKTALCGEKDSIKLEGKSGFLKYYWSTKQDARIITVKTKGWYYLAVLKSDSTTCYDSIYIGQGGKALTIGSNPKNATICKGDSIQLEATYGFKSYSWSVNGVKHSNGLKFKPQESVKVFVEGVDESGCVAKNYIYVTVKACYDCPKILSAYPSISLCNRDSVHLEAKSGYYDYKWNTGLSSRLLWVKKAGWYWIDFKDSSGNMCRDSIYVTSGSTKELKITLHPNRKVCVGDTIVFSATSGFASYGWNTGDKKKEIKFVAQKTKEIVCEAVDSSGCVARTVYKMVVDSCTHSNIKHFDVIEVNVFPNPTSNNVSVTTSGNISSIDVVDMYGVVVLKEYKINSNHKVLDLQELSAGNYILRLTTEDGTAHRIVIKTN